MKTRQIVCLLCSLCTATILAAPPNSEIPVWLRFAGKPRPSSLEIFDAFQTKAGPTMFVPSAQSPFLNAPPAI